MKVISQSKIKNRYTVSACQKSKGSLAGTCEAKKRNMQNGENQSEEAGREDMLWITSMGLKPEGGRKEGGHYCPRFGGATVWGEIDGCKQQITVLQWKGRFKKRQRL